jgi:hypothetical protein
VAGWEGRVARSKVEVFGDEFEADQSLFDSESTDAPPRFYCSHQTLWKFTCQHPISLRFVYGGQRTVAVPALAIQGGGSASGGGPNESVPLPGGDSVVAGRLLSPTECWRPVPRCAGGCIRQPEDRLISDTRLRGTWMRNVKSSRLVTDR